MFSFENAISPPPMNTEAYPDRKSTRLNSSHTVISYAVFCLQKKEHTSELQSHSDLVCRLLLEITRDIQRHAATCGQHGPPVTSDSEASTRCTSMRDSSLRNI